MPEVNDHLADTLSPTALVLYHRLARARLGSLHITSVDLHDAGELEQLGFASLEEVQVDGRDMVKAVLHQAAGL